jgi:hypothetical protein
MRPTADGGRFMAWQQDFLVALMEEIKADLVEVEAPDYLVRELTERIAFSVASLIDGRRTAQDQEGKELNPILCFLTSGGELVHCGGNSFMHEYIERLSDEVFGEKRS